MLPSGTSIQVSQDKCDSSCDKLALVTKSVTASCSSKKPKSRLLRATVTVSQLSHTTKKRKETMKQTIKPFNSAIVAEDLNLNPAKIQEILVICEKHDNVLKKTGKLKFKKFESEILYIVNREMIEAVMSLLLEYLYSKNIFRELCYTYASSPMASGDLHRVKRHYVVNYLKNSLEYHIYKVSTFET